MKNMLRLSALLAGLAVACLAADTTITDTITDAARNPLNCTVTIQLFSTIDAPGSTHIIPNPVTVTVTAGVFTVALAPNDTGTPAGTSYLAAYKCVPNVQRKSEIWYVPTTGSVLKIRDVIISTAPTPTALISLRQLAREGASDGQGLCWSESQGKYVPGDCSGGGGSSVQTFTKNFSAATSWSIPQSEHGFGNANLAVLCFDGSGSALECGSVNINPSTFNVTAGWIASQAGSARVYSGSSFSKSFTAQTTVGITAVEHGLSVVRFAACADAAGNIIEADTTGVAPGGTIGGTSSFGSNFTATFAVSQTGRCWLIGE